ncbi:MAG: DUF1800 domain-containing protein [Chitinophagaceae bacterium]|nr:MAG: DUF1800 domain-containing protein [Chitinophagaceae bacterium]
MSNTKSQHLIWRAAFGSNLQFLNEDTSTQSLFKKLEKDSSISPAYINVADDTLLQYYDDSGNYRIKDLKEEDRKMFMRLQRKAINQLNMAWLKEMIQSPAQLREKMAFFWHGHFACRSTNLFFNQLLLQVIRKNAIGNFGTLLKEVSQSAAMLQFLNNQQNKKNAPNENFAREVMELFTLGRGYYSEKDIKEGARAFTGWTANAKGEFVFRKNNHDTGSKTFLGKTGNFTGDDVLDIILNQRQTAKFITTKIYTYFVNEVPNTAQIDKLSKRFYESNYDINALLKDIYTSSWFYDSSNMGTKIKSPIELIVGIQRMFPTPMKNELLLNYEKILGQQLFYPPNVAGWPGGKTWIDSTTLMARMRLPKILFNEDIMNLQAKADDDQLMGRKNDGAEDIPSLKRNKKNEKNPKEIPEKWNDFLNTFSNTPRDVLFTEMSKTLLQLPLKTPKEVLSYVNQSSKDAFIKSAAIQIMSTPEYQMC